MRRLTVSAGVALLIAGLLGPGSRASAVPKPEQPGTSVVAATADAVAEPPADPNSGAITGTVTDDDGRPVPGACVAVYESGAFDRVLGRGCAGTDGAYLVAGLRPNSPVKVTATAAGYPDHYYPQRTDFSAAAVITMANGVSDPPSIDIRFTRHTGTVRGTIRWPDGTPAANGRVYLAKTEPTGVQFYSTVTRLDGTYELGQIPPADYRIALRWNPSAPVQWVPGVVDKEAGSVYTITENGLLTVDETILPTQTQPVRDPLGSITGVVRDRETGEPIADACVRLMDLSYRSTGGSSMAPTCTDASGVYTLAGIPVIPGNSYVVVADAPGHVHLWAPDAPGYRSADAVPVSANKVSTVNLALRRTGGILHGHILAFDGLPLSFATVQVASVDSPWYATTFTASNGHYEFNGLPPGGYKVSINTSVLFDNQWWPQQTESANAGIVTVTAGGTATADDTMLPAELHVKLVHETTGAPITDVCVKVYTKQVCNSLSGSYDFLVRSGWVTPAIVTPAHYHPVVATSVTLVGGRSTTVTMTLQPTTAITLAVSSSVDPAKIPRVCARAVPLRYGQDRLTPPKDYCNAPLGGMGGDPSGTLTIGLANAEPVQIFLFSPDTRHGAQWLGATGGTGQRKHAVIIQPILAASVAGPGVRMDRTADLDVDGYRSDRYERVPTCASPVGITGGLEGLPHYPVCGPVYAWSNVQWLGPYTWDVQVYSPGFATVWLPDSSSRTAATGMPYNDGLWSIQVRLKAGAKVSGTVTPAPGWTVHDVTAFNAISGDIIAAVDTSAAFGFDTLNTGPVLLRARATDGRTCWYVPAGSSTRRAAPYLQVTAGQTITGLAVPLGPGCRSTPPQLQPAPRRVTSPLPANPVPRRTGVN